MQIQSKILYKEYHQLLNQQITDLVTDDLNKPTDSS